jgi:hypothetical protein
MLQVFWLDAERSFSAQRLLEMQLGGRSGELSGHQTWGVHKDINGDRMVIII